MMAKMSHRRPVRYEKDQLGCMWGLINIFDFRHGRPTSKLISDKRHGSKQCPATGSQRNKFEALSGLDESVQGSVESNVDITATVAAEACKPSVKKFIEEEMVIEQDMTNDNCIDEVASNQTNVSQARMDHKKTKKTRKKSRDMETNYLNGLDTLESGCSCDRKQENNSRSNCGVDEIMEETPVMSNFKHSDFEEKLCLTIKEFMNQKLTDGKYLTEDQKIQHFRELLDALETLSSDEELFLKLLQDPNSLVAKHVLNSHDSQREKDKESDVVAKSNSTEKLDLSKQPEELVLRKQRHFFWRKSKPQEREPAEADESFDASKRIVILKPGPEISRDSETGSKRMSKSHYLVRSRGPNEKLGSHFFLSEIKRKLKNAMGKQQHPSLGVGEKGSVKEKFGSSPNKDHFYMERIAKPSGGSKKANKSGEMKESEMNSKLEEPKKPNQRVSNIYIEAKKHLSEMLTNGDAGLDFSGEHFPKSLGRILALPEYNASPRGSPGRDSEIGFVTAKMRLSPRDRVCSPKKDKNVSPLGQVAHNLEDKLPVADNNPEFEVPDSIPSTSIKSINDSEAEESCASIIEEKSHEGDKDIATDIIIVGQEEEGTLDAPSEPSTVAGEDQLGNMTEISDDEKCSKWLNKDLCDESPGTPSAFTSPSSPPSAKHAEYLYNAIGISERPSPVSVLDPLFSDDEISPSKTIFQPVELRIEPLHIRFEDHESSAIDEAKYAKTCTEDKELIHGFVKEVMQASGFNWDNFCMKWLYSDQLIEPSLYDDVELCPNSLCSDQKLLFDCINKVLAEVCGRYYGCFPWVSSVKPIRPVPDMQTAINEVFVEVNWHLRAIPLPHSLDQIVAKDLSRNGAWMDLRFDTETVGGDMGEAILQDLVEDVIISYVDGCPENEAATVSDELQETEIIVNGVN